ncbi:uncharacterized protein VP01_3712g2 [Puccinia sorghi]|uniref:Uncharacterized protein n=1 Tax=Puccinia sorghi TaxID=27349 RepID=A0A0L6UUW9_9BASI|nr:uncharacterized protein VP01_3712g2 [Puccinia sorghi]
MSKICCPHFQFFWSTPHENKSLLKLQNADGIEPIKGIKFLENRILGKESKPGGTDIYQLPYFSVNTGSFSKAYILSDLPIAYSAVINQLIAGHSSLNLHLFKAKRRLDPCCHHCLGKETPTDLFNFCPAYKTARQTRRKSNLAGITRTRSS